MQAYCEGTELNLESAEEGSIQYVGTNSNNMWAQIDIFRGLLRENRQRRYNDLCDVLYSILLIKN